jgi:hypothetical protein
MVVGELGEQPVTAPQARRAPAPTTVRTLRGVRTDMHFGGTILMLENLTRLWLRSP